MVGTVVLGSLFDREYNIHKVILVDQDKAKDLIQNWIAENKAKQPEVNWWGEFHQVTTA